MRAFLLSLCTWVLIAAGSYLAVTGALDYWESRQAQRRIAAQWSSSLDAPEVPVAEMPVPRSTYQRAATSPKGDSPVPIGAPVAKLIVPRLGAVLYVVEGTAVRDLKRGPGHLTGTALPGENGNCVIAGHRDTHFRVLKDVRDGDEVILERHGRQFRYRVDLVSVVSPENIASLAPTDKPVLNLITCFPFQYIGSAPRRFIVHAGLETSPLQAAR